MYAATTLAFVPGSSFFLSDLFKWKSGSFQLSAKQGQQKLFQMKYLEAVTVPANQEFSRFENGTFYTSNPFSALKESERTPDDGLIVEIPVLPTIPIQDFDVGIFGVHGVLPSQIELRLLGVRKLLPEICTVQVDPLESVIDAPVTFEVRPTS